MRPILTALLCLAPLAAASAQFMPRSIPRDPVLPGIVDRGTQPAGPTPSRDLSDLRDRIGDARDRGDITRAEARSLRREARQIDRLADRYAEGGLTASESRELDMRVQALRSLAGAAQTRKSP
ncbi:MULTISPECIES: hypothetical protein [unclassified Sphingopyxis]|uniref:hypothetical protein n=1 Tax=unclassified Sphingopyxis TaxID=2614943 RepID=UPI000736445B|nr:MULTISPECIES: hypothetical protein [unclassified Sphingopyxis]KTE41448.1 hypothetical protein ATE62_06120 [Sphingopyxis sp. HIX]KTE83990.1 hypothetical protein ATE72_10975 [Sphingopyxis sp. HXXIV]